MIKLPKLQIKKKELSLDSLKSKSLNPEHYWLVALILFVFITVLGTLIGLRSFQEVYFEEYRSTEDLLGDVESSMKISALENALEKRKDSIPQNPTPSDPSL